MTLVIPRKPFDVQPPLIGSAVGGRGDGDRVLYEPITEPGHVFSRQAVVGIDRHAQQPTRRDFRRLSVFGLLDGERRGAKYELSPFLFSECHRFQIVNRFWGKPLELASDQWSFLPTVFREIEFEERVADVIVTKEEPGVGERNHSRSVVYAFAVHLFKGDGRDCSAV